MNTLPTIVPPEFGQPKIRLRPAAVPHAFELSLRREQRISRQQVQVALAELAGTLYAEVIEWLRDIAEINPTRAVELYMQMLEFTVPKVKAVDVRVTANADADLKSLSMADLSSIVSEQ